MLGKVVNHAAAHVEKSFKISMTPKGKRQYTIRKSHVHELFLHQVCSSRYVWPNALTHLVVFERQLYCFERAAYGCRW